MVPLFLPQVLALLQSKVIYYGVLSSGWVQFQRDWTVQLFGTKGQKFLHCPGTKGQQDGLGQPVKNFGRDNILTVYPVPSHETKGNGAEEDILKQKEEVLKQKMTSLNRKGCSKTRKWRSKQETCSFFSEKNIR